MNPSGAALPKLDNNAPEPAYGIRNGRYGRYLRASSRRLLSSRYAPSAVKTWKTVLEYFQQKCNRSRLLAQQAERTIPGGIQHNLAFNYPFPLAMTRLTELGSPM